MLYLSPYLRSTKYRPAAENLFASLETNGVNYDLLPGTKDIWMRDISGRFWAFDSAFGCVVYSDINLDGGNIVFSPSKEKAIVSERVFLENSGWEL